LGGRILGIVGIAAHLARIARCFVCGDELSFYVRYSKYLDELSGC
jgi:hypothetical protein